MTLVFILVYTPYRKDEALASNWGKGSLAGPLCGQKHTLQTSCQAMVDVLSHVIPEYRYTSHTVANHRNPALSKTL